VPPSQPVQHINVNKLTPLQQAKKRGFQMDAAEANDKLTASLSACYYPVCWRSVRGAPALDSNGVEVNCNQQLDL